MGTPGSDTFKGEKGEGLVEVDSGVKKTKATPKVQYNRPPGDRGLWVWKREMGVTDWPEGPRGAAGEKPHEAQRVRGDGSPV